MDRRFLGDLADIAADKFGGKKYHYQEPVNKRVGNAVFRFWGRMFLIGLAFSFLSSASMIYFAWSQDRAEKEAAAETAALADEKAKRNPWALQKQK